MTGYLLQNYALIRAFAAGGGSVDHAPPPASGRRAGPAPRRRTPSP